jgi:uncharacterized protein (DUF1800 family)
MARIHCAVWCAAVLAAVSPIQGQRADRARTTPSTDAYSAHVLNRLAFGPRPGDVAAVRRLGVHAWIDQQLHPERIPQRPTLDARLKALESLSLRTWQLYDRYRLPAVPPPAPLDTLLTAAQIATLTNGTATERASIFAALTGDDRGRVLLVVPAPAMDGLSGVQAEAFNVRSADTAERQAQQRRLRPPLMDLLSQEQIAVLMRGGPSEKMALLDSLAADTRRHVLGRLQPATVPQRFRRDAIAFGQPAQIPLTELTEAKLLRALLSTRQLEEVLVDFWLNHFNVHSGKGPVRTLLTGYERDAIRPHVFGRFRDMVLATARHPAMLFYLDNWTSRARGLNENYARELLELHTLGVDGGYTQADVVAVARVFTGWTIFEPNQWGEFFFDPATHDREEKVVLGHVIPRGGGEDDGRRVIEILTRHPSTARFISTRLAQRFVADIPPASLVARMAAAFTRTDGDLRVVVQTMVTSPEFLSERVVRSKVKSPFELVVSALRALEADVSDTTAVAQRIADLGQPLYGMLEPTGYSNSSDAWASSSDLLGRMNLAWALTSGALWGVHVDAARLPSPVGAAAARLGLRLLPASSAALQHRPPAMSSPAALAAMLIASPEFQKR